jgi:hypothetical protein
MSVHPYHTDVAPALQESLLIDSLWLSEVVPCLPPDLETQARALKAFQRTRKLKCASDLLRALLAYVLCGYSFAALGAWALLLGLADISANGWRKRLRRANAWLLWLLAECLASPPSDDALQSACRRRRVRLVDATRLRQPGGTGDDWRLHTSYDLAAGRLDQVSVTDSHAAEGLQHFLIQPGDIMVGDSAYGYRRSIATVVGAQADGVLRIYPPTFPVVDAAAQPLDLYGWLRRAGPVVRSLSCWCEHQGRRYRVRLIAAKLPSEAARAARRRKWQNARDHGRKVSWQTLFYAGWVVLVTTLHAQDWAEEDVLRLYRARWQAELVYKRMKQVLVLNQLRSQQQEMVEATVRALLIAWALQEVEAAALRAILAQVAARVTTVVPASAAAVGLDGADGPLSSWLLSRLCLETLRQQVRGHWSQARVRACLAQLQRFLRSSPRRRRHQETEVRLWLEQRERGAAQPQQQAA